MRWLPSNPNIRRREGLDADARASEADVQHRTAVKMCAHLLSHDATPRSRKMRKPSGKIAELRLLNEERYGNKAKNKQEGKSKRQN